MVARIAWATAFIDRPSPLLDSSTSFWTAVTGSRLSAPREGGRFATLLPESGDAFLRVQRIDDGVGDCHLDLHTADPDALARLAVSLGAVVTLRDEHVAMTSPAGLRFCAVPVGGAEARPDPFVEPDGNASLVDQLCIDVPPDAYAAECRFWTGLTAWELRTGARPEFSHLVRPPHIPLRLLLQRLEQEPVYGRAHAHLDIACQDVEATTSRHVRLGASITARHESWTTMTDPTGSAYCLTARDPRTGIG